MQRTTNIHVIDIGEHVRREILQAATFMQLFIKALIFIDKQSVHLPVLIPTKLQINHTLLHHRRPGLVDKGYG